MAVEGQSVKVASDMEMQMKQRCAIEFIHEEKVASIDIHQCLLNVYGVQTVDMNIVKWWVVSFSSCESNVRDKPHSRRPCTAVTPTNEEHLISSSVGISELWPGNCVWRLILASIYWKQWKTGISQLMSGVSHKCSRKKRKNTTCKVISEPTWDQIWTSWETSS